MEEGRGRSRLIGPPGPRQAHHRWSHVTDSAILGNGARCGRQTVALEDGVVFHFTGGRGPRRIDGGQADESDRLRTGVAIQAPRRLRQVEIRQGRMEIARVIRACACVDMAIPAARESGRVEEETGSTSAYTSLHLTSTSPGHSGVQHLPLCHVSKHRCRIVTNHTAPRNGAALPRGGRPGIKRDMSCRYPDCKNRSKGPRLRFLCEEHLKLPKKKQDLRSASGD